MSFSRQMSRARFFDLRNSIAFGLADIGGGVYQPRGSGGNPMLRPYLAKQFDFGYEHRSEEHTSELQSLMRTSYAVFCLKTKKKNMHNQKYIPSTDTIRT